jgi:hypothetical protein
LMQPTCLCLVDRHLFSRTHRNAVLLHHNDASSSYSHNTLAFLDSADRVLVAAIPRYVTQLREGCALPHSQGDISVDGMGDRTAEDGSILVGRHIRTAPPPSASW